MSTSTRDITKNKRRPRPKGPGTPVVVRFQPSDLEALDVWRQKQPDTPSRPEAVRRILTERLKII